MSIKSKLDRLTKIELIDLLLEASTKDANFNQFIDNRLNKKSFSNKKVKAFQRKLLNQRISYNQAYKTFKEYSLLLNDSYTYCDLLKDYIDFLIIYIDLSVHDTLEELDDMIIDAIDLACQQAINNSDLLSKTYIANKIGSIEYYFEDLISELGNMFSGYFHEYYDEMD